jgi:hypothetical protein
MDCVYITPFHELDTLDGARPPPLQSELSGEQGEENTMGEELGSSQKIDSGRLVKDRETRRG